MATADGTAATPGIREHPLRESLLHEAHARPFESLSAPLRVSHLVVHTGTSGRAEELAHVAELCRELRVEAPGAEAGHFTLETEHFRLRWERHTEFSTYTVFVAGGESEPFASPALGAMPRRWLSGVPGELLAAVHVSLLRAEDIGESPSIIARYFREDSMAGSRCAGDAASVWTDFLADRDGFIRVLVLDRSLSAPQAGRLVQRLLEIETYRLMALLGFPLARRLSPDITEMETQLGTLMDRLSSVAALDDERNLLSSLSALSARVEQLMAQTNFRFSATAAYGTLVRRRLAALRERRIEGVSTLDEFMERRLAPALDTCVHMSDRLERVSRRVSRAANLLRTRVDVALEAQNRDLLESMNRRARLQLRLQETVEGLSVVILSYYSVSLIGYALRGAAAAGLNIRPDVYTALSIPVVAGVVALGVREVRRRVTRADGGLP
ncbi:DUF3422 family protein [Sediminicurvatus halobius]|uniref:DUF3422 domain-containing protein n=1 Tax=Sediminicurvatus halobius TaxID=2182432 RepID=A0A2U2N8U5_9GAMM|nr:DUF3422 domain-containing protein [Spiribacter halobius]PWG65528.1 DUF3422 domain-containing protein [Spiribacter halobius]UEX76553.1 DUF3422 domain-containing protein [Spiribacter halobius]